MMNTGDKGFTLIGLVIVIAILGILMAMAVPAFSNMEDAAEAVHAKAFASQQLTYCQARGATTGIAPGSASYYDPYSNNNNDDFTDIAVGWTDDGGTSKYKVGEGTINQVTF